MNVIHSAAAVLTILALLLTLMAGLNPPRVPLWIAVLLLSIALLVTIL